MNPSRLPPELSIVIPAFNEEERLPKTLCELGSSVLEKILPAGLEVIVVDDGSCDGTKTIRPPADQPVWKEINFRMISVPHGGKGFAVREGLKQAEGKWVLISDADLSTSFAMYPVLREAAIDGAIASRGLKDSKITVRQPGMRHELGRSFNAFVRLLTGLEFFDTQCGFKLLRKDAARVAAKYMTLPGFAFDVEMLMILKRTVFEMVEVPVEWAHMEDSRVRAFSDGLRMGWAVLKLRFQFLMGKHPVCRLTTSQTKSKNS